MISEKNQPISVTDRVYVINWCVRTYMCGSGDSLKIFGQFLGHPNMEHGYPPSMKEFDVETGNGVGFSGRKYWFDYASFSPNANCPSIDKAIEYITTYTEKKEQ